MPNVSFPRIKSECWPGMEDGVHAGYDKEGRELVYIGIFDMVMHKDVIDHINAEWDKVFK